MSYNLPDNVSESALNRRYGTDADEQAKEYQYLDFLSDLAKSPDKATDVVWNKSDTGPVAGTFMNLVARHLKGGTSNEILGAAVRAAFLDEVNRWTGE